MEEMEDIKARANRAWEDMVSHYGKDILGDKDVVKFEYIPNSKWYHSTRAADLISAAIAFFVVGFVPLLAIGAGLMYRHDDFSAAVVVAIVGLGVMTGCFTVATLSKWIRGILFAKAAVVTVQRDYILTPAEREAAMHDSLVREYHRTPVIAYVNDGSPGLSAFHKAFPEYTVPELLEPFKVVAEGIAARRREEQAKQDKVAAREMGVYYQAIDMDRALTDSARTVVDHAHAYKEVSLA
jgi:hypothetical protein